MHVCYGHSVVDDLKTLYCDGIEALIGGEPYTIYGGLIADNLAAHAVGGFKESMGFALRICRTCMTTAWETQTCFSEASCQLRNPERHFNECLMLGGPLGSHYSTILALINAPSWRMSQDFL